MQPGIQDLCTPAPDYCVVYLLGTRFIMSMAMYEHSSDEILHFKQTTLILFKSSFNTCKFNSTIN